MSCAGSLIHVPCKRNACATPCDPLQPDLPQAMGRVLRELSSDGPNRRLAA